MLGKKLVNDAQTFISDASGGYRRLLDNQKTMEASMTELQSQIEQDDAAIRDIYSLADRLVCLLFVFPIQGLFLDTFLTIQLNWSWQFLSFSEILLEFFSKFSLSFYQFSLIFKNFCFISTES